MYWAKFWGSLRPTWTTLDYPLELPLGRGVAPVMVLDKLDPRYLLGREEFVQLLEEGVILGAEVDDLETAFAFGSVDLVPGNLSNKFGVESPATPEAVATSTIYVVDNFN
ncbi:hypothetical protein GUJ93_ZPchr0013g34021 [Zizania palustris]|uniref:Uncharacterized protein n=1 Tax=Zizania palustris TaxID=103762 RepID=A0A8J5WRS1_ZIZPA|nr:hypothetical protein GUJ93_ZPchr0013g34021 [Zizania palustris]